MSVISRSATTWKKYQLCWILSNIKQIKTLYDMIRYINIFTRKYRLYQEDFIRWVSYDSLEEAEEGISEELQSGQYFKKTIIIEVDEDYDEENDLEDDFFEEKFPNTRHCNVGAVYYDIPND